MFTAFVEKFRKVTAVTAITTIVFSLVSPAFAVTSSDLTSVSISSQTGTLTAGTGGTVSYTVAVNRSNTGN